MSTTGPAAIRDSSPTAVGVLRWVQECINNQNYDILPELITDDFRLHAPAHMDPPSAPGPAAYGAYLARYHEAYPDLCATVEQLIVGEGYFAVQLSLRATHLGPYLGMPPTHSAVCFTMSVMVRLRNGRMAEAWQQVDALRAAGQLGFLPTLEYRGRSARGWWLVRTAARTALLLMRATTRRRLVRRDQPVRSVSPRTCVPSPSPAVQAILDGAPNLHTSVEHAFTAGDLVARRVRITGTHRNTRRDNGPTARPFEFEQLMIGRVRGGDIVQSWADTDFLSLLIQLGVVPSVTAGPRGLLKWLMQR